MIEIEFEEPNVFNCECCGNETKKLTRFVYNNDNAYAVYYGQFTVGHDDRSVSGIISLGEWGEGSEPSERIAFPFRICTNKEHYQMGLTDKDESPWSDVEFLGEILKREDALKHDLIKEVFHSTDHIVA